MPLVGVNEDANGVIDVVSINKNGSNGNGLNVNGNGNENYLIELTKLGTYPKKEYL